MVMVVRPGTGKAQVAMPYINRTHRPRPVHKLCTRKACALQNTANLVRRSHWSPQGIAEAGEAGVGLLIGTRGTKLMILR